MVGGDADYPDPAVNVIAGAQSVPGSSVGDPGPEQSERCDSLHDDADERGRNELRRLRRDGANCRIPPAKPNSQRSLLLVTNWTTDIIVVRDRFSAWIAQARPRPEISSARDEPQHRRRAIGALLPCRERDHAAPPVGVIGFDGDHSCRAGEPRDRLDTNALASADGVRRSRSPRRRRQPPTGQH